MSFGMLWKKNKRKLKTKIETCKRRQKHADNHSKLNTQNGRGKKSVNKAKSKPGTKRKRRWNLLPVKISAAECCTFCCWQDIGKSAGGLAVLFSFLSANDPQFPSMHSSQKLPECHLFTGMVLTTGSAIRSHFTLSLPHYTSLTTLRHLTGLQLLCSLPFFHNFYWCV